MAGDPYLRPARPPHVPPETPRRNLEAMEKAVGLMMYVGAAKASATPEQTERLVSTVLPLMQGAYRAGTVDEEAVGRVVRKIMGADWVPEIRWREGFWRLPEAS